LTADDVRKAISEFGGHPETRSFGELIDLEEGKGGAGGGVRSASEMGRR